MMRTLWKAIVFVTFICVAVSDFIVQYTDCPIDCICEKRIMASILSCNRLITEKNAVAYMPISKFELIHSDTPLRLTKNVLLNMGLNNVNVISISNANIEYIDVNAFSGLNVLTHIRITHSKINHLHPDTFKNIIHLTKLNLDGNLLGSDTRIASPSLEELHLADCDLNNISLKTFEQVPKLTLLNLTGNGIKNLSADVFDLLVNIEEINLSHNKINDLPENLVFKTDVLDLSYNPIVSFRGEYATSLESLNLRGCLITEIGADTFKNMNFLSNLDLSCNKIAYIHPEAFTDLHQLATIDLSSNELIFLSENLFVNNSDLQKLNFENNVKLNILPPHGFKAPRLSFDIYYFSCNNCNLKTLSKNTFRHMPNLLTLILSRNRIEDISNGLFQNLTSLIELDLSQNQITTIDNETFKRNRILNKINLSFNTLKALHADIFIHNVNLKYLDISNCGLYQLWTGDYINTQISSIVSINVSSNNIKLIKKEDIAITNNLRSLDISNNNLYCTEDLRSLIIYLQSRDIKNTDYRTHEKQSYDFETREKDETSWKQFAKIMCPILLDGDENEEIDINEYEENLEPDNKDYDNNLEGTGTVNNNFINDKLELFRLMQHRPPTIYISPLILFLGTAFVVLGLTGTIILYIVRRKNLTSPSSIMNIPNMSRIKKNSGLVYQQLSEEHGPKTPILNRFIAPVPVTGICGKSEYV